MSNEEAATEHESEDEERFAYLAADLKQRQRRRVRNRHVKDFVSRIIARRGFSQQQANEQLVQVWGEAVGKRIAQASHPGNIQRGVLLIEVKNSVIAQEIEFTKAKIVKTLQARLPDAGITRLRIRVG